MAIVLTQIVGYDELAGDYEVGTAVASATGATVDIQDQKGAVRDNRGRTGAIRIVGNTLVTGTISVYGRINPSDSLGWVLIHDLLTAAAISSKSVVNGTVVPFVLGADYRELRIDSTVVSGTMDIKLTMGT